MARISGLEKKQAPWHLRWFYRVMGKQFCRGQKAALSDERLLALSGNQLTLFNEKERAVIELADAMADTRRPRRFGGVICPAGDLSSPRNEVSTGSGSDLVSINAMVESVGT